MNNNQFGRTLIETLAILGVVGILSVSSLQLYAKAMNTIRVNHLMEKVFLLANQIRNDRIENTRGRKTFDLPSVETTLSYGFSFNSQGSKYENKTIKVIIEGDFSVKICKILKKKISTQEYAGLQDIKVNATSLNETGCPSVAVSSMAFIIDSEFKGQTSEE